MSCNRNDLEENILNQIKPTPFQIKILERFSNIIKRKISYCMKGNGLDGVVEEVGSFAKGTLLNDKWELDIFVLLKDIDNEWINNNGKNFLLSCLNDFPTIIKYSQHPYVTVSYMGLEADVVPTVFVEKPRKNGMGVERTPFHTRYINSKLNACQKDDVRLLKSFFKGLSIYGAESHIEGFSGYLSELLIAYYGNFFNALKNISGWKDLIYIDIEGNGNRDVLIKRYPQSKLIVVDPIDPYRNVAAAVSQKSISTLILASKLFLEKPNIVFFHKFSHNVKSNIDTPLLLTIGHGVYYNYPPTDIWGKLKKITENLENKINELGIGIIKSSYYTNESNLIAIGFLIDRDALPKTDIMEGPSVYDDINSIKSFIKKRLDEKGIVYINDSKVYGGRNKKIKDLIDFVNNSVMESGIKFNNKIETRVYNNFDDIDIKGEIKEWIKNSLYSIPAWMINI
ncbi:CCA-adding enzyme [Caldisphaera lagunensis DSM 15908]|uniref:CCA-adding enzyme n=1 Tax=Caldisphaera lagunensis (strain DSM 15908 / JCM 11604 / ANMR 0165 / IC-154) TaxID=1056495 RepID=L0A9U6_CALLD|nr:CCA tRNA nucleotidyltransferase [Caldisphaera lagunensis]AFZ70194.1 CCA-adding enzyme [Caldisphaera lagunensis DSM 15908]